MNHKRQIKKLYYQIGLEVGLFAALLKATFKNDKEAIRKIKMRMRYERHKNND